MFKHQLIWPSFLPSWAMNLDLINRCWWSRRLAHTHTHTHVCFSSFSVAMKRNWKWGHTNTGCHMRWLIFNFLPLLRNQIELLIIGKCLSCTFSRALDTCFFHIPLRIGASVNKDSCFQWMSHFIKSMEVWKYDLLLNASFLSACTWMTSWLPWDQGTVPLSFVSC